MASWLSISLPNPFKSLEEEEEEEEEEEDNEKKKIAAIKADEESEEGEEDIGNGVREDLSELTKTIGRQLWGVASFLAPPPSPPPAPARPVAEEPQPPSSPSSLALLGGIRSDFAEIGGSFKTGLSRLTTNKTVHEISRFASSLLQLDPDDEGSASAVGVTEEVLDFAIGASARPEPWLDFPLPHDDDFVMSEAQMVHASTVESLVPTLSALRQRLCPSDMTEGCFWKIYFVMLHPLLNEQDAQILVTPQVLEARGVTRKQLKDMASAELPISGVDSLSLETSSKDCSIQEEKSDAVEKCKIVVVAPQVKAHEPEAPDQWSEEDGEKGTVKQLGNEEDVSFSDLEDDDDDDEVCRQNARSKSTYDACVSSSDGSTKWVQLNEDSVAHGDKSKSVRPTSQEKSSEGEDWLTVDDFDFDKVETV